MTETFTRYDPAAVLQTGDSGYIAKAIGVVTRPRGAAAIARQTGLSRAQPTRSFGECGNPTLKTLLAVMNALGVQLAARHAA